MVESSALARALAVVARCNPTLPEDEINRRLDAIALFRSHAARATDRGDLRAAAEATMIADRAETALLSAIVPR